MTVELSYREDGPADAPPLVLLNSVGSSTAMWEPCVGPLAEHFRVIRVDARGHGASPAAGPGRTTLADLGRDVVALLDRLGLERVHLAGLSLGGMTAMWVAAHAPQRVNRAVLLCTSAHLAPATVYAERAVAVRAHGMEPIADAVVARWVTPGLAGRDPELMASLRAMLTAVDAESYAQCCEAIAELDLRPDLGRIAAPTLVIAGGQDVATPPAHAEVITQGIAGARLEVIDDAAHVATVETPGRIVALMLDHLRGPGTLAGGFAVRRAVLGDEYVDRALASTTPVDAGFQEFLTRYAWGEVWTRPGLSRRERSIATVVALTTLGAEHELAAHVRGALRNGIAAEEIIELLTHCAVYAGMPRANRAVAIARQVLAETAG